MRIGLFSHVCYPFTNGVSTSVEQLSKKLQDRDHQVTIISNNYDNFCNDFSNNQNIRVISLPIIYQNLRTPLLLNPALFKELGKLNLDILHSHSDFGHALIARSFSKMHNIPLVHTYHCDYLGYARENFGKHSPIIFHEPVKLYTKVLCSTCDRMIVPSRYTKKLLEEDFSVKEHIDFIPNGIDLEKFNNISSNQDMRKTLGLSDDDFVLLCLSRLSKEKQIDEVISLLPSLSHCDNLKLVIVGGGPDEEHLKKQAFDLNLNNVIFAGEVPFDRIQDYYSIGDLFITNSAAETQGLTIIEALASSLPAVCPNMPIYRELITDFDNGFLFDSYDELIKLINALYHNKDIIYPMRKSARESSFRFSLDNSVDEIESIYLDETSKKLIKH